MELEKVGCSLLKADTHPLSEETEENQEDRKNIEAGTFVTAVSPITAMLPYWCVSYCFHTSQPGDRLTGISQRDRRY